MGGVGGGGDEQVEPLMLVEGGHAVPWTRWVAGMAGWELRAVVSNGGWGEGACARGGVGLRGAGWAWVVR